MIRVKVNYSYFTLYKASSLNTRIIDQKELAFSSFFSGAYLYIRRSHGSRFSAIVKSDSISFYENGWMNIDRFFDTPITSSDIQIMLKRK